MTRASDLAKLLGAGGTVGGAVTSNSGVVVDNITIDGTEIDLSSGNLTLDVAGKIILDADSTGSVEFHDGGTKYGTVSTASNHMYITSSIQDGDIVFQGNDGGSGIEAARFDMSEGGKLGLGTGELGIGISERLTIAGAGNTARIKFSRSNSASTDDDFGRIIFNNSANTDLASIRCISMSGNTEAGLIFACGGGDTERARIDNSGNLLINTTTSATAVGIVLGGNGQTTMKRGTLGDVMFFVNSGSGNTVGKIQIGSSATSYVTSSDYRLKENVTTSWDATTRLKQLKPSRFNFIADADTTVDGFLAHEVSSIVPEAITGKKDGVKVWEDGDELPDGVSVGDNKLDADGNTIPDYQGIDQSKLVPLLVKTIQELEARITALESA